MPRDTSRDENIRAMYEAGMTLEQIGAHRPHRADYAAYERLKAELVREFPCLTSAEYERAVMVIARAAGV